MKISKKKIGIVIGDTRQLQYASIFEPLQEHFDIKLFTFEHPEKNDSCTVGISQVMFKEDHKMPGFMAQLEEHLSSMDAIVAVESSRLASFQALRSSRKFHIPIGVITSEFRPFFYEKYKNIRAIQNDIYNKATQYWALLQASESLLKLEGVPKEYIRYIGPRISHVPNEKIRLQKRFKFRKYIGLNEETQVILLKCDFEKCYNISLVIEAFHNLKRYIPTNQNIKLILCGQGTQSKDLKYNTYDRGLGRDVIFIHQDIEPFKFDLFSAADICIALHADHPETHEDFPFWLAEAMTFGVIPLIESGASELEFVANCKNFLDRFSFQNHSAESLTALMLRYLSSGKLDDNLKQEVLSASNAFRIDQNFASLLCDDIEQMFVEAAATQKSQNINSIVRSLENDFAAQQFGRIICTVEEMLLAKDQINSVHLATLMGFKGDAHYHQKQLQEAECAYMDGLSYEPTDPTCLRGLGNLLWHAHSHEEALSYFKKALQKRPDDSLSFFGIGMIYSRLGLNEDAAYWLQKAAESQPIPPGSLLALAQTCASLDVKGINILQDVVDTIEEHPVLLMTLGQMYLARGNHEQGNRYITMAQISRMGHPV
jgi:tetratricopeptide (TPR) repeat protein